MGGAGEAVVRVGKEGREKEKYRERKRERERERKVSEDE